MRQVSGIGGLVPVYRRRPSALHAARAGVGAGYCAALALPVLLWEHPLVLAGSLAATVAAALVAGVGEELRRAARIAVPLALLVMLVNPLVSQQGETLLVRGWEILGRRFDVTLEALAFGAAAGLRVLVLVLVFGLFSACVDPDELLRLLRRISYRSALTAALATRLVPVLARDAARMGEAARCRATPPGRAVAARAALTGALDRAVDVAAALEVRGYAGARRPLPGRTPWSRHDLAVAAAAVALALLALGARMAGAGGFDAYPELSLETGPLEAALAAGLPLLAVAPLARPAGRLGVAGA